ncbi:MAG TPA: glycoside hydrolase family 30 beta sandwich domain-containing protein [Chitinivibrionales bacterium]|nr:glycoside hydrolase family 30 beta sandwich domain-containing protein [Chitinivibrionales bacterium]
MRLTLSRILVFLVTLVFSLNAAVAISGTVKDQATQAPIQGAIVSLADTGLTCISDQNGFYSFGGPVSAGPMALPSPEINRPFLSGANLTFSVRDVSSRVRVGLYTLGGRLAGSFFDKQLTQGEYRINPFLGRPSSQICLLRVQVGNSVTCIKTPFLSGTGSTAGIFQRTGNLVKRQSLSKASAAVDSIFSWAVGYNAGKLGISTLTGTYDITLSRTVPAGQVQVLQTSQAGDQLAAQPALSFAADDGSLLPTLTVTPATTYQTIYGFGAAFTECAVYNLCKVTPARKAAVLNDFFNPYTGAGFSLMRAAINSCDFSLAMYDYDGTTNDYGLANFDMSHDMKWMIPSIKQALHVPGANFKLFGSPWAPPAWMKTSDNRLGAAGGGGGTLRTDCYNSWANYFVKYINTMKANGIPVWGITIQNEPAYDAYWEACVYSAAQERDFLKNALGPVFDTNKIDAKIMIWDHNKDLIVDWANTILGDAAAAKYAWGVAYHRYAGDLFQNLDTTHNNFPTYPLIATECSVRDTWTEAERMAHEIIGDLNNWSSGYLTWNLDTDYSGGPYHNRPEPGSCVGPIVLDSATDSMKIFPNYYYMTHFSKYFQPGAVRVLSALTGSTLEITACKNADGCIVVNALNKGDAAVPFKIKQGTQIIKPTIAAHALMSFIYF